MHRQIQDRLGDFSRIQWLGASIFVAILVAGVFADTDSKIARGVLALGVIAAILAVWNPLRRPEHPAPRLSLEVEGTEVDRVTVGRWREVDIESVVSDARWRAIETMPATSGLAATAWTAMYGLGYRKPTEAEIAQFHEEVERYLDRLRLWAEASACQLRESAAVLRATILEHNPATISATEAGIYVTFPRGAAEADETPAFEQPPQAPRFKLRPSPLGMLSTLDSRHRPFYAALADLPIPHSADMSIDEPWYEQHDDELVVRFRRHTVRHGETQTAGDSISVEIPSGEHRITWKVHAANLPHPAQGHWTVVNEDRPSEEPAITTLPELREAVGLEGQEESDTE